MQLCFVFCVLAVLVQRCLPACYVRLPRKDDFSQNTCMYDHVPVDLDSGITVWEPSCQHCRCTKGLRLGCCDLYGYPTGYADDCKLELDPRTCITRAVKKNNSTIECKFTGMVG